METAISQKVKKKKIKKSLKLISPLLFSKDNFFFYEIRKYTLFLKFVKDQNEFKPTKDEFLFLQNYISEERNNIKIMMNDNNFIQVSPFFKFCILNLNEVPLLHNTIFFNIENILKQRNRNHNISITKIKRIYLEKYGVNISRSRIHRIVRNKLKYSFKKTLLKPNKLEQVIYKKMSFIFIKCIIRAIKLNLSFVFIDESSFKLKNNNFRDWIKRDDFCHYGNNDNNKKINFMFAIGTNKVIYYKLSNDNTNSKTFKRFFLNVINNLNELDLNNTIFIMDNLSSHLTKEIKDIITSKKLKVLYTVPYESIFNPIELAFRRIKLITYKKVYKNISELKDEIIKIVNSDKFKTTLYKNFLETLEKYLLFIENNKDINLNL